MGRGIADDFGHNMFNLGTVTALEEVIGDEILCPVHGLSERDAEFLELFGVQDLILRLDSAGRPSPRWIERNSTIAGTDPNGA
jgi:hypothetical protein